MCWFWFIFWMKYQNSVWLRQCWEVLVAGTYSLNIITTLGLHIMSELHYVYLLKTWHFRFTACSRCVGQTGKHLRCVYFKVVHVCVVGVLDDEDVRVMLQGSKMVKVRSQRWRKDRSLKLLEDCVTVWCESSKTSRKGKRQQTCEYITCRNCDWAAYKYQNSAFSTVFVSS